MTKQQDANLVRQSELDVLSSRAIDLLTSEPSIAALGKAVRDEALQEPLRTLIADLQHKLRPADRKADGEALYAALMSFMRTGVANMTDAQRQEWMAGCMDALIPLPVDQVVQALDKAKFEVRFSTELLPFIMRTIKPKMDSRQEWLRKYQALLVAGMEHEPLALIAPPQ